MQRRTLTPFLIGLALVVPAAARADPFNVAWGGPVPITSAGWTTNAGHPACSFAGNGTIALGVGTYGPGVGCYWHMAAPGSATILSVTVSSYGFRKASPSQVCGLTFGAQNVPALFESCRDVNGSDVITTNSLARTVDVGIAVRDSLGATITNGVANNVSFTSGWTTFNDPTPPVVAWSTSPSIQTSDAMNIPWDVTDAESHPHHVDVILDGSLAATLSSDSCDSVWACGGHLAGTATIGGLTALADGLHTVTVRGTSAGGISQHAAQAFETNTHSPAAPVLTPLAVAAERDGWFGHAPLAVTIVDPSDDDVSAGTAILRGPDGKETWRTALGAKPPTVSLPARSFGAAGTYALTVELCDKVGHCARSTREIRWDHDAPSIQLASGIAWSSAPQRVTPKAVDPAAGVASVAVAVDGATTPLGADGAFELATEGAHAIVVTARDRAGNETRLERTLGIDLHAPVVRAVGFDDAAHALRIDLTDDLAGVATVRATRAGIALETTLAASRRSALVRLPHGVALDGAVVHLDVLDGAAPANGLAVDATAAVRPSSHIRTLTKTARSISASADSATGQLELWAFPRRLRPRRIALAPLVNGKAKLSLPRRRPARTTRFALRIGSSDTLRASRFRTIGTVRVAAFVRGFRLSIRGDRLLVRARYTGRGEVAPVHLLVREAAGGRWVEGCEQPSGGLGATLRQDGTIVGECRIPPTARGGTWLYRLQVAARPALWPWLATPSPVVRLTLSR